MKAQCENLKAYLDGELSLLERLRMRVHLRRCPGCRVDALEFRRLAAEIKQPVDKTVPSSLRDRVMADANAAASARAEAPASAASRSRAKGVFTVKRALFASAFVIGLVAIGVGLLPRGRENTALADVARAMSKVKSVHYVGWEVGPTGNRIKEEGWIKGSSKARRRREHGDCVQDFADDGKTVVRISNYGESACATISRSRGSEGWPTGLSMDLFRGQSQLRGCQNLFRPYTMTSRQTTLPNGRSAVVYELNWSDDKRRLVVLTVDAHSDLIVGMEGFKGLESGREKTEAIERIEYNVEIPDSVFRPAIPKGARVTDLLTPRPADVVERRKAEKKRLHDDPSAHVIWDVKGGKKSVCSAVFHPSFWFEVTESDGVLVAYVPDRNIYRVVGRARVYSEDGSYSQIVEDGEIRLPGKPQMRANEQVLMRDGGPGAYCGLHHGDPHRGFRRFVNVGDGPLTIVWYNDLLLRKYVFAIKGTAKLVPFGTVYRNQTVAEDDVPGHGLLGVEATSGLPKLDWGDLPASELKIAKAELDVDMRLSKIHSTRDAEGRVLIDGERVMITGERGGYYSGRAGIGIMAAGIGPTAWILEIESKRVYVIIGTVKVLPSGEICKNGRVSFSGEVLSSEE